MSNPFSIWAIITAVAFVIGWTYITFASLKETEFPLKLNDK